MSLLLPDSTFAVLDVSLIRDCVRDIGEIRLPRHHQDGGGS